MKYKIAICDDSDIDRQYILNTKIENSEHYVLYRMKYMWNLRKRDRDWYLDFEPEIQKMNGRVGKAIRNNHTAGAHFPMDFANMLSQILNFLLFGSVISLLHSVIIVLLAIGCVLDYFMSEWVRKKNWSDWKNSLLCALTSRKKQEWRVLLNAIENFLVVLVRDAAAYAFLIYKAVQGEVDASSFVLYFSAITSMSAVMGKILGTINRVSDGAMQVSDFREGLEVPDRLNRGEGVPTPKGPFSIEFKNVTFKYPKGEKKILDEPTAALDPIAEAAVYKNFNVLMENKTAVFISHRLSSCRFCDNIAVFDNGELVQQGSNDTLVNDKNGKYSRLWHAHAQYYQK